MKLEHLVSTMYQENMSFLEEMNCTEDVFVVNQTHNEEIHEPIIQNGKMWRMVSTKERGLSNSRNMLLNNVYGDIAIIGDDDLLYLEGYSEKIKSAYIEHPDADIIVFRFTQSLSEETRRQFSKAQRLNIFNISKVASVEITLRIQSIKKSNISFCSSLGLGAKYGACEENAFLADALRAGLTIWYVPETICYLKPDPPERVKWQNGFNREYFVRRGACFYRIYRNFYLPFSIAFLVMKKRNKFRYISIMKAFVWMLEGKRQFKREREK